MDPEIGKLYGNKVRVRVCGLCWRQDKLLMVNHKGLTAGSFWSPPGGGLEFGESVDERLEKEFFEETGLRISRGRFLFGCEFIQQPLHAIELFFEVEVSGGELQKGDDPERSMIQDVRFMSVAELISLAPSSRHGVLGLVRSPEDLKTLNGFFRI